MLFINKLCNRKSFGEALNVEFCVAEYTLKSIDNRNKFKNINKNINISIEPLSDGDSKCHSVVYVGNRSPMVRFFVVNAVRG